MRIGDIPPQDRRKVLDKQLADFIGDKFQVFSVVVKCSQFRGPFNRLHPALSYDPDNVYISVYPWMPVSHLNPGLDAETDYVAPLTMELNELVSVLAVVHRMKMVEREAMFEGEKNA